MNANPAPANTIEERVLALAGLAQALRQVRQIAETGQADSSVLQTATDSVFRLEADTPVEVYGDEHGLVVETAVGAGTKVMFRVPKFAPGIHAGPEHWS